MKKKKEEATSEGVAEKVLGTLDSILPGLSGFLKKASGSKVFGARIGEIQKEINRRFGGAKK